MLKPLHDPHGFGKIHGLYVTSDWFATLQSQKSNSFIAKPVTIHMKIDQLGLHIHRTTCLCFSLKR